MNKEIVPATGKCQYCGQWKTVMIGEDKKYTQAELDRIATSECDCPGAKQAQEIEVMIRKGHRLVKHYLGKTYPESERIMDTAIEPIFRGTDGITKVVIKAGIHTITLQKAIESVGLKVQETRESNANSEDEEDIEENEENE